MKKTLLTVLVAASSAFSSFAGIQDHDDPHGNGVRLNFHMGLTGALYGADKDADKDFSKDTRPAKTFGVEFGHKFTFAKFSDDKFSVGLAVDWISFDYGYRSVGNTDVNFMTLNLGITEFGPSFTYALNDDMGIDLYYQLQPTVLVSGYTSSDDSELVAGFGFTHAVGIGYRYKIFNIALEPNFGNMKASSTGDSDLDLNPKINTSNFRILLGFKF